MSSDMEPPVRHPGRREAAVAMAAAAVLLLVAWVADQGEAAGRARAATTLVSAGDGTVDLDLPGTVTRAQIAPCLTPAFARGADDVTVLYGRFQRTEGDDAVALVLRNDADDLRVCDSFGPDSPAIAPTVLASPREPVRFLTNGRRAWDCDGARLDRFIAAEWLSVSRTVAAAELRFVVDGHPGPWFHAESHGGLIHLYGWLGAQPAGARVEQQVRILRDRAEVVRRSAAPVSPCTGGDAQLG